MRPPIDAVCIERVADVRRSACVDEEPTNVLWVDPSSASGRFANELAAHGYGTLRVPGMAAALAVLRAQPVRLIVSELLLSDGSGLQLLRELKSRQCATPVVIVSAFATVSSALVAVQLGAVDCLCLPTTVSAVLLAGGLRTARDKRASLTLEGARETYIRDMLSYGGSISTAARLLGVDRRSLRRSMIRYASKRTHSEAPCHRIFGSELRDNVLAPPSVLDIHGGAI